MKIECLDCSIAGIEFVLLTALIDDHESGARVVGTITVQHLDMEVAAVARLFVKEDVRRRRYGSLLLAAAERIARDSGCISIALTVERGNQAVRPFYAARGYMPAVEWPDGDIVLAKGL